MKQAKGYLCTIIAAIGFGLQPLMADFVFKYDVGSMMLAFLRVLCMTPVFLIIMLVKKEKPKLSIKKIGKVLFLSLTGAVLTTGMLFQSYNCIDTGTATTLNFTYPVFVLLFGIIIFKEKLTKHIMICFILCVAGIIMFCNPSGNFTWQGFFLALGSGLTYGVYVLYMDKSGIMDELGFYSYTFFFFLFSTIMLFPVTVISGQFDLSISVAGWLFVIIFAVDGGIVATVLLQIGVITIGSRKASILSALEPVTSIVIGVIFLEEKLTVMSVCGIALVLASTIYLVLGSKN